jgi:Domain of unknown function (DUF4124)
VLLNRRLCLLSLLLASCTAFAQTTYRCQQDGRTVLSDRPCNSSTSIGAYGPAPAPTAWAPQRWGTPAPAPKAAEHLGYLGGACASLSEAIRTAPSRGVRGSPLSDLQRDYRRQCLDEDRAAREQHHKTEQAQRERYREAREDAQRERAVQAQASAQCGELKRILRNRSERWATLSEGERGDLERSKAAYHERCGAM